MQGSNSNQFGEQFEVVSASAVGAEVGVSAPLAAGDNALEVRPQLASTTASALESKRTTAELSSSDLSSPDISNPDLSNPELSERWNRCLSTLNGKLDPQVFSAYFRPLRIAEFEPASGVFQIFAPSRFVINYLEKNYREYLELELAKEFGVASPELKFHIDPHRLESQQSRVVTVKRPQVFHSQSTAVGNFSSPPASAPYTRPGFGQTPARFVGSSSAAQQQQQRRPVEESGVNPKYTFENFIVGNNSQFCHAAAMRCAEEPGRSYNPLFIYGGVGLGKTHLLHAIGNSVLQRNPNARVLYLSSETFTNELIHALRNAKMNEFKQKLRSIEVLLIDDIQFIVGKERTQEEFFHTFNELHSARHQIVLTSDRIPQDIPGIEERLQTRFSWGLTADMQAPDFETRVAILKKKAAEDGFTLAQDVAHFIAEKVSSNVRELEGALTRLHAMSSLQRTPLTIELAKTALKPLFTRKAVNLTSDDIKKAVASHFGIKASEMSSKRRTKSISFPRHVAMYLCRKHTTLSYPEIGGEFGGRDHSSVIHAAQVVSTKISADASVKQVIVEIERALIDG